MEETFTENPERNIIHLGTDHPYQINSCYAFLREVKSLVNERHLSFKELRWVLRHLERDAELVKKAISDSLANEDMQFEFSLESKGVD